MVVLEVFVRPNVRLPSENGSGCFEFSASRRRKRMPQDWFDDFCARLEEEDVGGVRRNGASLGRRFVD